MSGQPVPDNPELVGPAPPGDTDPAELASQVALFAEAPLIGVLLDAMPSGVLILNQQRQAVFANQHLRDGVGAAAAVAALGKRPGDLLDCRHVGTHQGCGTTPSCNYCGAAKAMLAALRGEAEVAECSISPSRDARPVELRVWSKPLSYQGHQFAIFVFEDIAEERRRRALEHIFFHDVLNTAGMISGAAKLLGAVERETLPSLEQMIVHNAQRMIDEVEGQRDLLAAEAGELACDFVELDSLEMLREQARAFSSHPVAEQREVTIADASQSLTLVSDRRLLGRVIGNMVKNALEASEPGQAVTLRCQARPDDVVRFAVHNPTHMPRAVKMQIFDRTFSTKGSGRGLGTRSIKLLTERYLGGAADFTSEEGSGTTFWIDVPTSPPPATSS